MSDEERLKLLYTPFAEKVQDFLHKIKNEGLVGGIFAGYRSYQEQEKLYSLGRTVLYDERGNKVQRVTNAKPGRSYHNFGLAVDYVFKDVHGNWTWNGQYSLIGKFAKECGLEWGGDFPDLADKPHIQMPIKHDLKKLDFVYRQAIVSGAPLHRVWDFLDDKSS